LRSAPLHGDKKRIKESSLCCSGFIETAASKKVAVTRQYLASSVDENASLASACINHRPALCFVFRSAPGAGVLWLQAILPLGRSRRAKMSHADASLGNKQLLAPNSNVVEFMQNLCVWS